MLQLLHIENIAVIQEAEIQFDSGFNVLTGETGAGKSIVIDAISAILGERTYRDVIRTGSDRAFVSAVFTQVPQLVWFEENRVDYDPRELLIQREIHADGKNYCRVNGRPVTVALLKQLGTQLVQIHGQHDSQQLFDEQKHLIFLDLFARDHQLLAEYGRLFEQVEEIRSEIRRLSMDESEKLRLVESLKFQIDEITRAELTPGEDRQLEERRKVLRNSEKLVDGLQSAVFALYGDENRDGASSLLSEASGELSHMTRYDEGLQVLSERLKELMYSAQDIAEELRDRLDSFSYSGEELERIESRLDVLHRLKRKYGSDADEILTFCQRAEKQLQEIEFSTERLEKLNGTLKQVEKQATEKALELRQARQIAAEELQKRLGEELAALDMPRASFVCDFSPKELSPDGMDQVRFLMTANVGEALKPMSKVASGGELARIMLAIKNVLAEQDQMGTLIFDEVDAGVSGRAAQKVAEKLLAVSRNKQVLCVTHLPQIAAAADHHLLISKAEQQGRTYTHVTALDLEGRRQEIARIIGGAEITEITLKSAEEMLRTR